MLDIARGELIKDVVCFETVNRDGEVENQTNEDLGANSQEEVFRSRHILQLMSRAREENYGEHMTSLIHIAVYQHLKNLGVELEVPSTRGRSKVRKSNNNKGAGARQDNGSNRLVEVKLTGWDILGKVPIIIKETCEYLRKHLRTEGIFRKSGSSSRVQTLMQRFAMLEKQEEFCFTPYDTVYDVASALKQYLRELETPLIPYEIHGLIRGCLEIPDDSIRDEAILLCTCLLPEFSISILTYLISFLNDVVDKRDYNKMGYENLAIVMGPNIMPVEVKKPDKTKELEHERKYIDAHTKILEAMIRNPKKLGCLTMDMEKRVECDYSARGSEDELENDGVSRRKKRRSGSLTRVLGFLRKVASSKTNETPSAQTPGNFSDFTHTPVMKSNKRRCLDENIFSLQKKKTVLDGIRKNGLTVKDDDKRFSHITDTPNSLAGFITCPSPVCLNPSPMKVDWKQTPNTARFKNLVTPSLLRKKDKHADTNKNTTPFSAPAKPVKVRLGLGKKLSKKQPIVTIGTPVLTDNNGSTRPTEKQLSSSVSIQKLVGSPRKVIRASSTRIPRPDKINPVVRKSNSSCRFPVTSPRNALQPPEKLTHNISSVSGEYVKISPSAQLNDIRNDAFIASKLSCLEDTVDLQTGQENEGQVETNVISGLRLTPLIQEINTLTLSAQEELTLSGLLRKGRSASRISGNNAERKRLSPYEKAPPVPSRNSRRRSSGASSNKARLQSPPDRESIKLKRSSTGRRDKGATASKQEVIRTESIRNVEDKFTRAMKETKIMRIQSERSARVNQRAVNIHRRFSIQDKGLSPAQRRIVSNAARRKSHESNQTATKITSTAMITTPLNDFCMSNIQSTGFISRSPNRCTLKRGRPNTLKTGLARPSPASSRNNSTLGNNPNPTKTSEDSKENTSQTISNIIALEKSNLYMATPMRRMSSVQELVKLMETGQSDVMISQDTVKLSEQNHRMGPTCKTEPPPPKRKMSRADSSTKFLMPTPVAPRQTRSAKVAEMNTPKIKPNLIERNKRESSAWVPASDFNFDKHRKRFLRNLDHHEDRDSIHALKTLNAGKVSENVKLFNGMSRTRKSPGKSLIPRYVALHRQESFNNAKLRSSLDNNDRKHST